MKNKYMLFLGLLVVQVFGNEEYHLNSMARSNNEVLINLTGSDWTLTNEDGTIKLENVTVPGGVYSTLMKFGVIPEILQAENDVATRWVGKESWTYTKKFDVPDLLNARREHMMLVFHGLDTIANITLNGLILDMTDNMFVRYRYDVKYTLKEKDNELIVKFFSPVTIASKLQKIYPTVPTCVPTEYHGECGANMLRKMQASFSWDWGPAFPSQGIWKSVELESYDHATIRDVNVFTQLNDDMWNVSVKVYMETGLKAFNLQGSLQVTIRNYQNSTDILASDVAELNIKSVDGVVSYTFTLPIHKKFVELWWTNGLGAQPLYPLEVSYVGPDSVSINRIKRIGFRTIELVQEPTDNIGLTFFFKVNDVDVFMKGSNWIPADILPEWGANYSTVQWLLKSAKDAHMNMLRVWGGGVYESELFYETCDELGILIWQDFMFACAMYPTYEKFLNTVEIEVVQNARRLQHHPSIAIWAGNNENEAALRQNWYGTITEQERYEKEYKELYVNVIRDAVRRVDPSRTFLVSSPSNGINSEDQDFIASDPQDYRYGDMHVYNYVNDGWDPNIYPKARFVSEYGFQGLPSHHSWTSAKAGPEHRQHLPLGYKPMVTLIKKHLPLPSENSVHFPETAFYYSQISQAMATRTESEAYRVGRISPAKTMGALYWQLNDVWVAPSWSSIEYNGDWKMLHYHATEFFAPTIVSMQLSEAKMLKIFVVRDPVKGIRATLKISYYGWDSLTPRKVDEEKLLILNEINIDKILPKVCAVQKKVVIKKKSGFMFTLD
ncbi:beta-mannosidase-like [Ctenocephalides felis]|uniref:beta-mannosidase-like n=1 Tax=Ctenocephalides felis TaxID=7515 RepID=UPI000E6E227B|nr:beta-mannosidase-like [Ctenocephalides felis]